MAVALLALFVALGGIGYAAATGSIDSREIKNNSVRGKDVRNKTLTGKDVKDRSLTGADVGDDSLAGADVLEGSLGQVPSAASAANADNATRAQSAASADSLGALRVLPIKHRGGDGANQTLFSASGLELFVNCTSGNEDIRARTTVADGEIGAISDDAGTADQDTTNLDHQFADPFNPGEEFDLQSDATAADDRIFQLHYLGGDGTSITAILTANQDVGGSTCVVSGFAVIV